jgi:hypothetical protein
MSYEELIKYVSKKSEEAGMKFGGQLYSYDNDEPEHDKSGDEVPF